MMESDHPFHQPLCHSFVDLAEGVWRDIGDAYAAGLMRDEETITNNLLLELWRRHPHDLFIRQLRKPAEAVEGADWEWWLTDGGSWFGMLVQAKKLDVPRQRYLQLAHRVKSSRKLQVDFLIEEAARKGVAPIYCFYNYTQRPPLRIQWNCGSMFPADLLYGCSFSSAYAVRSFVQNNTFDIMAISKACYPWSCLMCCPIYGEGLPTGPNRLRSILSQIFERTHQSLSLDQDWSVPEARSRPPEYVQWLLDHAFEDREESLGVLREAAGPVGTLAVMRLRTPSY